MWRVICDKLWYAITHPFYLSTPVQRLMPDDLNQSFIQEMSNEASYILTTSTNSKLFLGSAYNASDYEWLKENNITTIVNATNEIRNYFATEFEYHTFPTDDTTSGELNDAYFTEFCKVIDSVTEGNILVHCYAGKSRSAALVLYYLINRLELSFEHALDILRERRPTININVEFIRTILNKK